MANSLAASPKRAGRTDCCGRVGGGHARFFMTPLQRWVGEVYRRSPGLPAVYGRLAPSGLPGTAAPQLSLSSVRRGNQWLLSACDGTAFGRRSRTALAAPGCRSESRQPAPCVPAFLERVRRRPTIAGRLRAPLRLAIGLQPATSSCLSGERLSAARGADNMKKSAFSGRRHRFGLAG